MITERSIGKRAQEKGKKSFTLKDSGVGGWDPREKETGVCRGESQPQLGTFIEQVWADGGRKGESHLGEGKGTRFPNANEATSVGPLIPPPDSEVGNVPVLPRKGRNH